MKSVSDTQDLYFYEEMCYKESHRAIVEPFKIKPHVSMPESGFNPQGCNPSPVTMGTSWSALKTVLTVPFSPLRRATLPKTMDSLLILFSAFSLHLKYLSMFSAQWNSFLFAIWNTTQLKNYLIKPIRSLEFTWLNFF